MVAPGITQSRRNLGVSRRAVGWLDEVAEELTRAERARSDLDESQAGCVRQRSAASEAKHLAPVGRAPIRQPARADDHMRREAVHAGETDEVPCDRAFTHEHERCRFGERQVGEGLPHAPVEHRLRLGLIRGHTEPDRANGTR